MKVAPQRTQWIGLDPTCNYLAIAGLPRVGCKTHNVTSFDQIDPEKESLRRGWSAPNPTLLRSALRAHCSSSESSLLSCQ